jgi:hypothetical protein
MSTTVGDLARSEVDGATGGYLLSDVQPGDHTLTLWGNVCQVVADNVHQSTVTVTAATTTTHDLDISATTGRVVGAITVNGAPLPNPAIYLEPQCGYPWGADDSGHFAHHFPPGSYTASVRSNGSLLGSFAFTVLTGQTTDVDIGTTPTGIDVTVELSGGIDAVGGISLTFTEVLTSGQTTVVESGAGPPPDTGFRIVGLSGQPRYWNIDTAAEFVPPVEVCIHYDPADTQGNEENLTLRHDDGDGWEDITDSIDVDANIICGLADSLSPFAVFEPLPTQPTDADEDGVDDDQDACLDTADDAIVDATGCSIADHCPCLATRPRHTAYVSCVTKSVRTFVRARLISPPAGGVTIARAALSRCGG